MSRRRSVSILVTLVLVLASATAGAQVIWSYPRDFEEPLHIEEAASYNVWAWIPGTGGHDVKIGDSSGPHGNGSNPPSVNKSRSITRPAI